MSKNLSERLQEMTEKTKKKLNRYSDQEDQGRKKGKVNEKDTH